ncbi:MULTISPECIES: albusnodin family lasso peptide [Streptomyces]|nr:MULTISPECIES: albusnodin family lasso peptide [Streptomyces]
MDEDVKETAEGSDVPTVIDLGDAAALTRGSSSSSVESKQTPYS